MKKTLTLLILLITSLAAANAEEITVWEGELAGNLRISSMYEIAYYNQLMGDEDGQANLSAGDMITISYTGATSGNKVYVQDGSWSSFSSLLTGCATDQVAEGDGTYFVYVSQALINKIESTGGFVLQRSSGSTYSFTKVTVTKGSADEILPPANEQIIWFGHATSTVHLQNNPDSRKAIDDASLSSMDTIRVYMSEVTEGNKIWINEPYDTWPTLNNTDLLTANQKIFEMRVTPDNASRINAHYLAIQRSGSYVIRYVTIAKFIEKPEITVWQNAEGYAGNLQFTIGTDLYDQLTGSEIGQANLAVGDAITIYYKDAVGQYDKIYIKTSDLTSDYDPQTVIGVEELDDYLRRNGESFYDLYITSTFLDAIKTTGLGIQRGAHSGHSPVYLLTKITVKKPDNHLPGYEMLYNGEPTPIAWGENPYLVPKRDILNLQPSDKIHIYWDRNETWEEASKNPTQLCLCYKAGNSYINSSTLKANISKNDAIKEKSFVFASEDITKIKGNNLYISGYYYNLTKAYLEHPARFVSVSTNSDGLATFSHPTEAIDCSWFESLGLKAYTASVSGDRIVTTKLTEAVPAATGLILQGEPSTTYKLPFAAGADAVVDNVLQPTTGSAITGYVLAKHSTLGVGFFKVTDKVVEAGKAYIPATTSARYFSLDFLEDETTDIRNTPPIQRSTVREAYNLMGQRVSANSKGLVIINGKKVFNK